MGSIFCVMGKSSSGKDSIFRGIMKNQDLKLERIIPYTTRPIREGEAEGREYHFCDEAKVQKLQDAGKIVELRSYDTVYGIWKYFTVDDGEIDLSGRNYLYIVTLEGYQKMQDYFGKEKVVPIYIEVEDGERLLRAIARERQQAVPKYEEMCRRFLADARDFSEEKLLEAGITRRFENRELAETIQTVTEYIKGSMA
ncbi:MAG: guanylate kinase [Lachnospiraceae bacterium]|nr:guanylate kinase [Lachnospiraceae bacterium]